MCIDVAVVVVVVCVGEDRTMRSYARTEPTYCEFPLFSLQAAVVAVGAAFFNNTRNEIQI